MHPDDAGNGNDRGDDRLPDERAARISDPRRHQGRDAEHEQVERAAHQLGDDEDEARDQPGKGDVHGGSANRYCGTYATSFAPQEPKAYAALSRTGVNLAAWILPSNNNF